MLALLWSPALPPIERSFPLCVGVSDQNPVAAFEAVTIPLESQFDFPV